MSTQGYWYLDLARHGSAKVLALRFNLEEAPENNFAVAIADRLDLAMDKADAAVPPAPACPPLDEARAAMRDVMGWNTIWDGVNHRALHHLLAQLGPEEVRRLRLLAQRYGRSMRCWSRCSMLDQARENPGDAARRGDAGGQSALHHDRQ